MDWTGCREMGMTGWTTAWLIRKPTAAPDLMGCLERWMMKSIGMDRMGYREQRTTA